MSHPAGSAPRPLSYSRLAVLVCVLLVLPAPSMAQDPNECDVQGETPDLVVGAIPEVFYWGDRAGVSAFSIGTTSCNLGTCWANWFSGTPDHPVIGQNMFRLKDGRYEHIGQSWLKHGFFALSEDLCSNSCVPTNGQHLGVNCSDPYTSFLNGLQDRLGPKFEINPATGEFPFPPFAWGMTGSTTYKRLQVATSDVSPGPNAGAIYYVEGQYIARDDALAGNDDNNSSLRRITITGEPGGFVVTPVGVTLQGQSGVFGWQASDPLVNLSQVAVPGDGTFWIGSRATDLGGGWWHYEYAVHNLNSDRGAAGFRVPVPPGASVANVGFHDVAYHSGEPWSGTDWTGRVEPLAVSWVTQPFHIDPVANALRWGTLYNFRFDADLPPGQGLVSLALFGPGAPSGVATAADIPSACDADGVCEPGETCSCLPDCGAEPSCCGDGACDPGETDCACPQDCGLPPAFETACDDGLDDDCDGATDCNDVDCCADPSCDPTDGDGDGYCQAADCDDANPGCNSNCTDVDGDGFCIGTDCDDSESACTTDCSDADGDGFHACGADCDDANPRCDLDCTDADGDGWCVTQDCDDTNPDCNDDCTDGDADGFCLGIDCDDSEPACTTDCSDADGDGLRGCDGDCDEGNPSCSADCTDVDGDGWCVGHDCNDADPGCSASCVDADDDGYCVDFDCDDADARCTLDCTDADADGWCVGTDCEDTNPNCAADCTDADGDGWCIAFDCDDNEPRCTVDCTDIDGDGWCLVLDCDVFNPNCNADCTDADGDDWCAGSDCDDTNPACTADCTDVDGDGLCPTVDCDDSQAACTTECIDLDGDGVSVCGGDCDDSRTDVHPGLPEECGDGRDNDCNGVADAAEPACAPLVLNGLSFVDGITLSWNPATGGDTYALYRGTIPFAEYDHRCHAARLTGETAQDRDAPPPGEGFYYIVTRQLLPAGPLDEFGSGPLGLDSIGAPRPDSAALRCGARVYVDPDLVAASQDGQSWGSAYTGVGRALQQQPGSKRSLEIWIRGTVADGSLTIDGAVRDGVRILGGFSGNETVPWQRSPELNPTLWDGEGGLHVLRTVNASVSIDGLSLRNAVSGVLATPAGALTELTGVDLTELSGFGLDHARSGAGRLIVDGCTFGETGLGGIRSVVDSGPLTGRLRDNVFAGGLQTTVHLEARATTATARMQLDVLRNTLGGAGTGLLLLARVDDAAYDAEQFSRVGSNLIHGVAGDSLVVEAQGTYATAVVPAAAVARPLIVGNTISDGTGAGVVTRALRTDSTADPSLHPVLATPLLWNNLITFHASAAVEETADDDEAGIIADPDAIVGNILFGNAALYRDEGTTDLPTVADVNSLAGAGLNFSVDPTYVNRSGGDFHLQSGSPAVDSAASPPQRWPVEDLDGQPRISDGDNDGVARLDVGADEL